MRDRSAHPRGQRENEPERGKNETHLHRERNEMEACIHQQRRKMSSTKSGRSVRESHIHEERAIINLKEEEGQKGLHLLKKEETGK